MLSAALRLWLQWVLLMLLTEVFWAVFLSATRWPPFRSTLTRVPTLLGFHLLLSGAVVRTVISTSIHVRSTVAIMRFFLVLSGSGALRLVAVFGGVSAWFFMLCFRVLAAFITGATSLIGVTVGLVRRWLLGFCGVLFRW